MSHYINSLLIEPVVRQARRFSRPSNDDTSPQSLGHLLTADDGAERRQREASLSGEAVWERGWRRDPGSIITTTSGSEVFAPDSGRGSPGAALRTWRHDQHRRIPFRQSENSLEGSSVSERSYILSSDNHDRISTDSVYRLPESLRSTSSSLHSAAQAAVDSGLGQIQDSTTTTRQHSLGDERHSYEKRSRRLPADDGMSSMRKRIVAIQMSNSSSADKARQIHHLMTEQYNSSQSSLQASHSFGARSPASLASHERPVTPASLRSMDNSVRCASPPTSLSSVAEAYNPFNLTPEDLEPTFYREPTLNQPNAAIEDRLTDRLPEDSEEETKPLGCPHYQRNIKLQCSACYRWYTCRFCHDEAEDHSLNRRETKNMLCMLCGCAQAASDECSQCGERSARYYCSVCKLWDNDHSKSIYHCNDCGICRIGQGLGKDFYHCKVRPFRANTFH
ncbi:MAG: hypothetical protein Q9170_005142 [Blastenia crenularia]